MNIYYRSSTEGEWRPLGLSALGPTVEILKWLYEYHAAFQYKIDGKVYQKDGEVYKRVISPTPEQSEASL